jgi:hypothetical protein
MTQRRGIRNSRFLAVLLKFFAYEHIWRMYPPYRGYREATDRIIALVVREPSEDSL